MHTRRAAGCILAAAAVAAVASAAHAAVIIDMQMLGGARGSMSKRTIWVDKDTGTINMDVVPDALLEEVEVVRDAIRIGPTTVIDDEVGESLRLLGSWPDRPRVLKQTAEPVILSSYEPHTMARGTLQASLAYAYYPFDHAGEVDLDGDEDYRAGVLGLYAGYAFTSSFTAGVTLPFITTADPGDPAALAGGEGMSDIPIDLDVHFLKRKDGAPFDLGVRGRIQLPTGDTARHAGLGHTVGRADLRGSLPFGSSQTVRLYASLGGETDFSDEVEIGACNYAFGVIWNGMGRSQGWGAWGALSGSKYSDERQEPGTEPFDSAQELRLGGGYLWESIGQIPRRNMFAVEMQVPTNRDGLWSTWSVQASYGIALSNRPQPILGKPGRPGKSGKKTSTTSP